MTAQRTAEGAEISVDGSLSKAVVAFGSNMGDRRQIIDRAIDLIEEAIGACLARSDLMETEALVHPDDDADWHPPFLNGVAVFATGHPPHEVLHRLLMIETDFGRQRLPGVKPWQPRPIDLDLIAVGSRVMSTDDLTLPHPRMHERHFVLEPMASIMPDWRHPIVGQTVVDMLERLTASYSAITEKA